MFDNRPYLNIGVPGMERILPPDGRIYYYSEDVLNVVIHGAPGSGKTLFALQTALNISTNHSKGVFYLTKDTNPVSLFRKMALEFGFFDSIEKNGCLDNDGNRPYPNQDGKEFIGLYNKLLEKMQKFLKDNNYSDTLTNKISTILFENSNPDMSIDEQKIVFEGYAKYPHLSTNNFEKDFKKLDLYFGSFLEKHFKFIKDQSKVFDDNGFFNEIVRLLNSFFDTEQFSLYTYFSNPKAVKSYLYDYNNDFELESFIEKIQENRNNGPGKKYYDFSLKNLTELKKDIIEGKLLDQFKNLVKKDDETIIFELKDLILSFFIKFKYNIYGELLKKENNPFIAILTENKTLAKKYIKEFKAFLKEPSYSLKLAEALLGLCRIFRNIKSEYILRQTSNLPMQLPGKKKVSTKVRFNIIDNIDSKISTIIENKSDFHDYMLELLDKQKDLVAYFSRIYNLIPALQHLKGVKNVDDFLIILNKEITKDKSPEVDIWSIIHDAVNKSEALKNIITDLLLISELDPMWGSYFSFCEFNPSAFENIVIDRYSENTNNALNSMERLCPTIAPIFSWLMKNRSTPDINIEDNHSIENQAFNNKIDGIRDFWRNQLVIVCDSISPQLVEQHINLQQGYNKIQKQGKTDLMNMAKPLWIFILESSEMPQTMNCTFPPDIQIQLLSRKMENDVTIRSIQIHKARFQKLIRDPFHYIIIPDGEYQKGNLFTNIIYKKDDKNEVTFYQKDEFIKNRSPGIHVLPSVSSFNPQKIDDKYLSNDEEKYFIYGKPLDEYLLRNIKDVIKGGTTLVLSEGRCLSTPTSLYYLLTQYPVQKTITNAETETKNDSLYISLDYDLDSLLDVLFSYKDLANRFIAAKETNIRTVLIKYVLENLKNDKKIGKYVNRFYRIPLPLNKIKSNHNLFILNPQLSWNSISEVIDTLNWILNERKYCHIKRVVFYKVSCIKNGWPLIDNPVFLINNLVKICQSNCIDLMIVDDTANQSSTTGHLQSIYNSIADSVIRLKRVFMRGKQTVALEVIRVHGSSPKYNRPLELFETKEKELKVLKIEDSFRGYCNVFTDYPKPSKIKVLLPYDAEDTALKAEVEQIKLNFRLLFDDVEVNLLGPHHYNDFNSIMADVAAITHETCYICAIDEIWFSLLLGSSDDESYLSELKEEELEKILLKYIKNRNKHKSLNNKGLNLLSVSRLFSTQALSIAQNNREKDNTSSIDWPRAIPFYHNWGVFVVCQPNQVLIDLFKSLNLPNDNPVMSLFNRESTLNDISGTLWNSNSDIINPTWEQLSEFKSKYWKPFYKNFLNEENQKKIKETFPEGIDLKFFSLIHSSQESIVSFFIELILSYGHLKLIFSSSSEKDKSNTVMLKLVNFLYSSNSKRGKLTKHVLDALNLFKDLLSDDDRLAIGLGKNLNSARPDYSKDSNARYSRKPSISLFSRQWITSVPKLQNDNEIRDRIILKHLPTNSDNALSEIINHMTISKNSSGENAELIRKESDLYKAMKKIGPTVGGTWYLGTIKGGNIDLAADIIKEMTSLQREQNRIRNRIAAGVYRESYGGNKCINNQYPCKINEPGLFPYSRIMRELNGENGINFTKKDNDNQNLTEEYQLTAMFPFSRLCINKYPEISGELYRLIKNFMMENDKTLKSELVNYSLKRIAQIYDNNG